MNHKEVDDHSSPADGERTTVEQKTGYRQPFGWSSLLRALHPLASAPGLPRGLWQRPVFGYAAAIALQSLVWICIQLPGRAEPQFHLQATLLLLPIPLIALGWGVGPSILALFLGTAFYAYLLVHQYLSFAAIPAYAGVGIFLYLILGLTITLLASQMQNSRYRAALETHRLRQYHEDLVTQLLDEREARQAVEQKIEVQEHQLDALLEVTNDALFILNLQGTVPRLSQAAKDLLDLPPDGEISPDAGRPFDLLDEQGHILPPAEWPEVRLRRGDRLSEEDAIKTIVRTRTGQLHNVSITGVPIRDADGVVTDAILVYRDVTERYTLEQKLVVARQEAVTQASQLEALFEAMTDGVFVYDARGKLARTNLAARSLMASYITDDDIIRPAQERAEIYSLRRPDGQPMPPAEVPAIRILHGEDLRDSNAADVLVRQFNGSDLWLNMTGTPLRDEHGHISGAIAIARDVTERRALEQRTRKALDALLEMAQAIVHRPSFGADAQQPEERSRLGMQRMARLTGELLGCQRLAFLGVEPETELVYPLAVVGLSPDQEKQWWQEQQAQQARLSESLDTALAARLRANEILMLDFTHPPFNDQPNPYGIRQMLMAPMVVDTRLLGLLTLDYGSQDHIYTPDELALTKAVAELAALVMERDRLQAENAQARANELAARSANRLKDEFISIASHELRTPMTSVKANIQLSLRLLRRALKQEDLFRAQDKGEQLLTQLTHFMERAEQQVERQNRLVRDLLDVSRIETGRLELQLALCDLVALTRETVEDQLQVTPMRTIQQELPDGELLVMADRDRLSQVMSNYLSNALKYSEEDCPVIVRLQSSAGQARFSVQDQGPGLSATDLQHVWERFYRAPDVQVKSGSGIGLGLGLHISRLLIERQNGSVGVESQPGQGSTFWFSLPLAHEV